jgi:hypothetical protein
MNDTDEMAILTIKIRRDGLVESYLSFSPEVNKNVLDLLIIGATEVVIKSYRESRAKRIEEQQK